MTAASRLSTTGMAVGILVGGMGVGIKVSVGGAMVGGCVSVGILVGGAAVVAAGAGVSTGAAEGSVQAVSRKIRAREVARKFFIAVYL
jgi:hypothetical protein